MCVLADIKGSDKSNGHSVKQSPQPIVASEKELGACHVAFDYY